MSRRTSSGFESQGQEFNSSSKYRRLNSHGSKEFIYGVGDKTRWSSFLDQLAASFLTEKISYILEEEELARRKIQPTMPARIPPSSNETPAQAADRRSLQSLADDDYKAKQKDYRDFLKAFPEDFGTAIAIVLQKVSDPIRDDLHEYMALLPACTPESRYLSMRARLEEKWGPNSQTDAIDLRDKLSRLSGDVLGWETYCKKFTEIVKTLTKTLQRDEHGAIIRGPPPSMPFVPLPASPTSLLEREEYYYAVRDALARWVANPVLGLVLNHAPTELERKGILLRALGSSEQGGYSGIAAHYRLSENECKPLSSIWKDLEQHIQYEAKLMQKSNIRPQSTYSPQLSSAMSQQGYKVDRPNRSNRNTSNSGGLRSNNSPYNHSPVLRQQERPEANRKRPREDFERTYDANSAQMPCKNCQGAHTTRECPSTNCSSCGATFSTAQERKQHYIEVHAPKSNGVRFSKGQSNRGSKQRQGTPRHSAMHTSNQFSQSMEIDCTASSKEGYESSAQDSTYSNDSGRASQRDYMTDDSYDDNRKYIFEARMQTCVNMATEYRSNPIVPPRPTNHHSGDIDGVNWVYPCFLDIHMLIDVSECVEESDAMSYVETIDFRTYRDGSYIADPMFNPPGNQTRVLDSINIEHAYTQTPIVPQTGSSPDQYPDLRNDNSTDTSSSMTNNNAYVGYMQEIVSINSEVWKVGAAAEEAPRDRSHAFPAVFPLNRIQPGPRRRYAEEEIAQLGSYFIWQGERGIGWKQSLRGIQWASQSNTEDCEKLINMVRVQTDDGEGYGPSYEGDEKNDDVLGIIDTGAQISTIPEMLVTEQRWINTRRPSPEGTAIKYGNSEIQEVYNQIHIGSVLFHITPNRCSSPLISVCQLTALGHTVTFSNTEMCIDDATLQYGLRFGKLPSSRDWKIPLTAIERLAKLRLAHPAGGAPGSSRRIRA